MKKQTTGVRHGEVALIPTKDPIIGKTTKHDSYILAHSETDHNHVLEGQQFEVIEAGNDRVLINLLGATNLVHQKTHDKHKTLTLPPALYDRYEMVEYSPAEKVIQVVKD